MCYDVLEKEEKLMLTDNSKTKNIKILALDYLKSKVDQEVSLREIRNYVLKTTRTQFSSGVFSSAMRDLMEESEGRVLNTDRGIYKYTSVIKKAEINKVLSDCVKSLRSVAYVNYLDVTDEDLEYIKMIPNIIEKIEDIKM